MADRRSKVNDRDVRYFPVPAQARASAVDVWKAFLIPPPQLGKQRQVWWELRRALRPLWETTHSATALFHMWFRRRKQNMQEALEGFGLRFDDHLRPSIKQARSWGLSEEEMALCKAEAVGTTVALLLSLVVLKFIVRRKELQVQCANILGDLCCVALGCGDIQFDLHLDESTDLSDAEEPICHEGGLDSLQCGHMAQVNIPRDARGIAAFLIELHMLAGLCHRAREWLAQALGTISHEMDSAIISQGFGEATIEYIPVLRGRSRRRRIDKDMVLSMVDAVIDRRFRSSSRMAVAGSMDLARTSARTSDSQLIADYQLATHLIGSRNCQVQVSRDASVIGGEDTTFFAAWFPLERICAWLVPQATRVSR